ncbi:hypothetical protein [Terrabacter sp. 2YAF2]|uniref:hypothetical protein n=1 Tax=Terrabacter sp. 2YAF2 TaxID=3233026 RepID=UPI003F9476D9
MPHDPETTRNDRSGASTVPVYEQITQVFLFETTYTMGGVIQAAVDAPLTCGRKFGFPATLLWGLLVGQRAAGSTPRLLHELRVKSTWRAICENYAAMTGGDQLPPEPPNHDEFEDFMLRMLTPDLLIALYDMLRRCALGQAWEYRDLMPGLHCSFLLTAQTNMVYGDATCVA